MVRAALNRKPGYTFIELLVTMGIIVVIMGISAYGLTYFQNTITIDNAIRTLKAEIQSTQNSARNSLVVRSGANSGSNLSTTDISVGWIFNMSETSGSIRITKRSVYFQPGGYDLSLLREGIKQTFVNNTTQNFNCQGNLLFNGSIQVRFASSYDLFCSDSSKGATEFMTSPNVPLLSGVAITNANGITLCSADTSTANIFFTSGYGEAVFNTNTTTACQIKIRNNTSFSRAYRALKIQKDSGSVYICGNDCTS